MPRNSLIHITTISVLLSCRRTDEVQDRKYFHAKVPRSQTHCVQLLNISMWKDCVVHYSLRKQNSLIHSNTGTKNTQEPTDCFGNRGNILFHLLI